MSKFTVGQKIAFGFSALIIIATVLGCVGYFSALSSQANLKEVGLVQLPSVKNLLELESHATELDGCLRTLAMPSFSIEMRKRINTEVAESQTKISNYVKTCTELVGKGQHKTQWEAFDNAFHKWENSCRQAANKRKHVRSLNRK